MTTTVSRAERAAAAAVERPGRRGCWSPSTTSAGGVDGEAAVGVAVEGEAEVGAARRRRRARSRSGWVAPHPSLMLVPSGAPSRTDTSAPTSSKSSAATGEAAPLAQSTTMRRPSSRRPSREPATAASQRVDVVGDGEHRADAGAGGRVRRPQLEHLGHDGLDGRLDLVGELAPAGGEQLDAVVGERVVRGRDDRAGDAGVGRHPRHRRRGRHAEQEGLDTLGRQAGDEGGLQHRARTGGCRGPPRRCRGGAEDARRGPPEGEGELGGELGVGDPADAVGAEGEAHAACSEAAASAWSTAAPCGPS